MCNNGFILLFQLDNLANLWKSFPAHNITVSVNGNVFEQSSTGYTNWALIQNNVKWVINMGVNMLEWWLSLLSPVYSVAIINSPVREINTNILTLDKTLLDTVLLFHSGSFVRVRWAILLNFQVSPQWSACAVVLQRVPDCIYISNIAWFMLECLRKISFVSVFVYYSRTFAFAGFNDHI